MFFKTARMQKESDKKVEDIQHNHLTTKHIRLYSPFLGDLGPFEYLLAILKLKFMIPLSRFLPTSMILLSQSYLLGFLSWHCPYVLVFLGLISPFASLDSVFHSDGSRYFLYKGF
jgi:hypothetical protein